MNIHDDLPRINMGKHTSGEKHRQQYITCATASTWNLSFTVWSFSNARLGQYWQRGMSSVLLAKDVSLRNLTILYCVIFLNSHTNCFGVGPLLNDTSCWALVWWHKLLGTSLVTQVCCLPCSTGLTSFPSPQMIWKGQQLDFCSSGTWWFVESCVDINSTH